MTKTHRYPEVQFGNPDDELLPLTQCVCGARYTSWEMTLSVYDSDPVEMPCCGRRLYFSQVIAVHEVLVQDAEGRG